MKEETYICAICGRKYPISQREEFDGQSLCPHCFTEETVACHVCGERVWTDDNAGNSDTPLCEHCYDRYYINCVRCGELLHNDASLLRPERPGRGRAALPCLLCPDRRRPAHARTTVTSRSLSSMETAPGSLVWSWRSMGPGNMAPMPESS